jgi:hypothetical protein
MPKCKDIKQMKIATGITATKRYLHASDILARRLKVNYADNPQAEHLIILVTDQSDEAKKCYERLKAACKGVSVEMIPLPLDDEKTPYKTNAQLMIAQMETAAFERARDWNADYFWSVEPDVLPPPNALRCLIDTLNFDRGYYDIAMVTYPSQGGGSFLGGRGTPNNWILPDVYEDERKLTNALKKRKEAIELKCNSELKAKGKLSEETQVSINAIRQEIEKCPVNASNIFDMQGRKWRRRGWLNSCYPAIGKGAILPTDWVGMGCTLISRKALNEAHFEGYKGAGTQDLFLTWKRWHPAGLRRAVITHIACEHITRKQGRDKFDEFELLVPSYESEGEYEGHLRLHVEPYYTFAGGEEEVTKTVDKVATIKRAQRKTK